MAVYNLLYTEDTWNKVNVDNKELLDEFVLELKQQRKSKQTIYQYKADLKAFLCYITLIENNRSVLELTKKDFRNFSIYLIEHNHVSVARHNRVLSVIRSLLNYAELEDDLDYEVNQARRIKGLSDDPVKEITFLEDRIILDLCTELEKRNELQKALLLMLSYDSAGRKGELAQVNKSGFSVENRHNTNSVIGKGNKKFSLLYFDKTKSLANLYLLQRGKDNLESLWGKSNIDDCKSLIYRNFVGMRNVLETFGINSTNFTPHSMRHSSLTNYGNGTHYICRELNKNGFPLEKLKLIAHHNSIDTTQSYLPDTTTNELEEMFDIKLEI